MRILNILTTIFTLYSFSSFIGQPVGAQPETISKPSYSPTANIGSVLPLYSSINLKIPPTQVRFYQLDLSPLGNRTPLLLVHGLRGEYRSSFRWNKLVKRLQADHLFVQRYKIYFARYNSIKELNTSVSTFKQQLTSLYNNSSQKPITVMALSLGGNLVQLSMQDPRINSMIAILFGLATPFHGSPLFCKDWFMYSLYKNLSYPLTRIDHRLSYNFYFEHNKSLLSDLKWDNSDSFMPNVGYFHSRLPLGPSGNLTIMRDTNEELSQINQHNAIAKSKLITYSGYLINPYLLPTLRRQFETTLLAPYTFLTVRVPAHLAREHPVLKMLNREISRIVPGTEAPHISNWPHMYGLNDGITPVSSAIYLPAEICQSTPLATEDDLMKIRSYVDVKLARVFRNADHLTFIDGYHPHHTPALIKDQLNPNEPSKLIFDWILSDLLDINTSTSEVAKEPNLDKSVIKD